MSSSNFLECTLDGTGVDVNLARQELSLISSTGFWLLRNVIPDRRGVITAGVVTTDLWGTLSSVYRKGCSCIA